MSAGSWIDVCCIVLIVGIAAIDARKGFSSTLSALLGLLITVHAGYWFYPAVCKAVSNTAYCQKHAQIGAVLPYVLAVLLGCAIFAVIRFAFRKFFKLIVEQPLDGILGVLGGVAKAMLIILLVFSCASLFPEGSGLNNAFHHQSWTGRCVVPVLQNVFQQTYPRAQQQIKKQRDRVKTKKTEKTNSAK